MATKKQAAPMSTVDRKFGMLNTVITTVCDPDSGSDFKGLFIAGPPGMGKTFTTEQVLHEQGYQPGRDYMYYKGRMSGFKLYFALRENPKKILIFDDCDDVFNDIKAMNLLKGALDAQTGFMVDWDTDRVPQPSKFAFEGKIIVLTNYRMRTSHHYGALLDRAQYFAFKLTHAEVLEKIAELADLKVKEGFDKVLVDSVHNWFLNLNPDLHPTFRVFNKACALAQKWPNWQEMATYMLFDDETA